ncbi:unnamed protein product [Cuscuta epithymum]|uniref:SWIM-type domain-containing protein n=1 Tax=Cuscuta epithymum TaxID=186058 RepID=A0AAV0ERZ0_9ASTE|nr:unnamed protein product [Cuscuta epithymum]
MEIYKIPCSHVLAVCRQRSLSYAPFVDKFFSSDQYAATYHRVFKPIPDRDYWPNYNGPEIVHDPSMLRAKGRPKSTRIKNEMDDGPRGTVRCGRCHQTGHNRATCAKRSSRQEGGSAGYGGDSGSWAE